jgi:hypothetical protein
MNRIYQQYFPNETPPSYYDIEQDPNISSQKKTEGT